MSGDITAEAQWRLCEYMRLRRALRVVFSVCVMYVLYLVTNARFVYLYGRVACTASALRQIEGGRGARVDQPPARAGHARIRHVVFSTSKNSDVLRRNIERVVYSAWRNLSAQVAFEVFSEHASTPSHARELVAVDLPSMYILAAALYPVAQTYTFVNSDCVSNLSFVATLDALLALGVPFYATGRRMNVHWTYTSPPVLVD